MGSYVSGKNNKSEQPTFIYLLREQLTDIFLIAMLLVYPLYTVDGYFDLIYVKWEFFLKGSIIFISLSIILNIVILIKEYRTLNKSSISFVDKFVLAYLLCVIISYLGAIDRKAALWGVDTWYMGLVAQLLFIGIYFCVSRGYYKAKYLKYIGLCAFLIVSGIVILQRFRIDAFHFHSGMSEEVKLDFVTTMGQVTWTSSYVSIILILLLGIFYKCTQWKRKILWGIGIFIGFAALILLNCDSGVVGVGIAMMILLWMALGNHEGMKNLVQIIMIALAAVGIVGIFERLFLDRLIPIDPIYTMTAQSPIIFLLLIIMVVYYYLLHKNIVKIGRTIKAVTILRCIYGICIALGIILLIVLFVLHGKGYFAGSPTENYFRFTVWWGNSRGFIWRTGAAVFADFSIGRKLFGCGPDSFTPYAYQLMGDAINEFWHNQLVPNAHNEWFNAVINYGIIGGGAYLGIFLSSAKSFISHSIKRTGENPELFGIGLAIIGYIAHNVLCYQQLIGTPTIFILIGLGEALRRKQDYTKSLFLK